MKERSGSAGIRQLGQRCLFPPPSFAIPTAKIRRSDSNASLGGTAAFSSSKSNSSTISLSEFLNKKLNKSSSSTKSHKVNCEAHPLNRRAECADSGKGKEYSTEKNLLLLMNGDVFRPISNHNDVMENSRDETSDQIDPRKKRKCSSSDKEGQTKRILVLGDDPKLPKKRIDQSHLMENTKPSAMFNHYANGRGMWDYAMEGLDTDVGWFGEVWEGLGSTSLGEQQLQHHDDDDL